MLRRMDSGVDRRVVYALTATLLVMLAVIVAQSSLLRRTVADVQVWTASSREDNVGVPGEAAAVAASSAREQDLLRQELMSDRLAQLTRSSVESSASASGSAQAAEPGTISVGEVGVTGLAHERDVLRQELLADRLARLGRPDAGGVTYVPEAPSAISHRGIEMTSPAAERDSLKRELLADRWAALGTR